jgi:hypothetical protein
LWVVNQPYTRDRIRSTGAPEVVRLLTATDGALFVHVTAIGTNEVLIDSWDPTNRATVSSNGHLWIQATPLDPGLAADEWTGSVLDTAGAIDAGVIDADHQYMLFTGCRDGICSVSYRLGGPLVALISGRLTCESGTVLRLDGSEVTLRFEWADRGYGGPPEFDCRPHEVKVGDEIAPNRHYGITAYRADGQQVSLAVTREGRLLAGDFAPAAGCPCVGGT